MPGGEQELSQSEVTERVRRKMERDNEQKKLANDVGEIKKKLEPISDFCKRNPDLCDGQAETNTRLKNLEAQKGRGLIAGGKDIHSHDKHGHSELEGFLSCMDSDDPKSCNCDGFTRRCSPSLAAKLTSLFLCDEKCRQKLDEMGFNIEFSKKSEHTGMLGGH